MQSLSIIPDPIDRPAVDLHQEALRIADTSPGRGDGRHSPSVPVETAVDPGDAVETGAARSELVSAVGLGAEGGARTSFRLDGRAFRYVEDARARSRLRHGRSTDRGRLVSRMLHGLESAGFDLSEPEPDEIAAEVARCFRRALPQAGSGR